MKIDRLHTAISELIHSDIAIRYNINNMPTIQHLDNMQKLIHYVLQPIRLHFDSPIDISGGYRSRLLWTKLRDLGLNPSPTSMHLDGKAADFTVRGVNTKDVFNWIKNSGIEFDELIYEYSSDGAIWIHIAYNHGQNRNKVIDNYKAY